MIHNDVDAILQMSIAMATEWEQKKGKLERAQKQRLELIDKKTQGRATERELEALEASTRACNELVKEIRALDLALTQNSKEIQKLTYV